MRDDNDYLNMGRRELREHLVRVSKEIGVWSVAAAKARQDETLYYLDGYRNSRAKAVTERKLDGEMHADEFTREAIENEGYVAFYTAIRDLILVLMRETP